MVGKQTHPNLNTRDKLFWIKKCTLKKEILDLIIIIRVAEESMKYLRRLRIEEGSLTVGTPITLHNQQTTNETWGDCYSLFGC